MTGHGTDHIDPDQLTPADLAHLDQNWSAANAITNHLVALNLSHRLTGCHDWYCCSRELADDLDKFGFSQLHILLRVAIERLTELPQ